MKIKVIYIYGTLVLAAIIFLFIVSNSNHSTANLKKEFSNSEMPQDEVHKGLTNPQLDAPNKNNLSEDYKKELAQLQKAAEDNPKDTLALRIYADFLTAAHQQEKALPYYKKILKINPKRSDILFAVSYIYFMQKDYDRAEHAVNQILKFDKNNVEAIYNLGAIAATKGDKEKAQQIWLSLIKEHPNTESAELAKTSLSKL